MFQFIYTLEAKERSNENPFVFIHHGGYDCEDGQDVVFNT